MVDDRLSCCYPAGGRSNVIGVEVVVACSNECIQYIDIHKGDGGLLE